jgi:DNA polymerase-3 subunit epsilon
MTSWHLLPRAGFDLETTGRDPEQARIVTASIIVTDGSGAVLEQHEWLADPGVDIPAEAAAVHGVTTDHARSHGQPVRQVVAGVAEVLGQLFAAGIPVMAFNACYDFTVLAREGLRHNVPVPEPIPVIDPYIMDKQSDRFRRGRRTLGALCESYGVSLENAHTSAADVQATLEVAAAMAARFPQLQRPAVELHESQIGWAARQAASFEEYLRRNNPLAVVDGSWPAIAS